MNTTEKLKMFFKVESNKWELEFHGTVNGIKVTYETLVQLVNDYNSILDKLRKELKKEII